MTDRRNFLRTAAGATGALALSPATLLAARDDVAAELSRLGDDAASIAAVGHRVVHGGSEFTAPTLIDDHVETAIAAISALAPLHNLANLAGIRAARLALPRVPHVAVFDTAFHQSMPASASTYAIDREVAAEYGVRRYGFHGTSYEFVAGRAATLLGRPLASLKLIVLHLGNGASLCAMAAGRSIATSMPESASGPPRARQRAPPMTARAAACAATSVSSAPSRMLHAAERGTKSFPSSAQSVKKARRSEKKGGRWGEFGWTLTAAAIGASAAIFALTTLRLLHHKK
jgi:butyrate kinase